MTKKVRSANHSGLLEVLDGFVVPTTHAGYIVNLLRRRQRIVIPQLTMIRPGRWHLWASCPLLFQWPQA